MDACATSPTSPTVPDIQMHRKYIKPGVFQSVLPRSFGQCVRYLVPLTAAIFPKHTLDFIGWVIDQSNTYVLGEQVGSVSLANKVTAFATSNHLGAIRALGVALVGLGMALTYRAYQDKAHAAYLDKDAYIFRTPSHTQPFTYDIENPCNGLFQGNFEGAIPKILSFQCALAEHFGRDYQIEVEAIPATCASAAFKIVVQRTNFETAGLLDRVGVYYVDFFSQNAVIKFNVAAPLIKKPTAELIVNCLRNCVSNLKLETP